MGFFIPNSLQIQTNSQSLLIHSYPSLACYLFNKLFNSIACLLYFINLQLVIPGRTWILMYLGRTMYKCLWACLALYGGPRWTLCQFQRDQSNNKQFDSFLLYIIYFLYFWDIFGQNWGGTDISRVGPGWSRWVQLKPILLCDITDITEGAQKWHFPEYWYEMKPPVQTDCEGPQDHRNANSFTINQLFKKL